MAANPDKIRLSPDIPNRGEIRMIPISFVQPGRKRQKWVFACLFFLFAFLMAFAGSAIAGDRNYYEPPRGSAERKAMMDAARIPVTGEIGMPVIFVVEVLRTDGHMAYLQAVPVNPDSTPLDWNATPFHEDWNNDFMSDTIMVLMENRNGQWIAVDHVIGPTDVHWLNWTSQYGLPEALFYAG